jgi:hypothetical protein
MIAPGNPDHHDNSAKLRRELRSDHKSPSNILSKGGANADILVAWDLLIDLLGRLLAEAGLQRATADSNAL